MDLSELLPEEVIWKPVISGQGGAEDVTLELKFRLYNIEDESWLKRTYEQKRLQEIFEKMETKELAKIAWHQLDIDSKRSLMQVKFLDMTEEGKEFEIAKTGPEKIGHLVSGLQGIIDLIDAILKTRGLSLPKLQALADKIGLEAMEQLFQGKKLIGQKFSTL